MTEKLDKTTSKYYKEWINHKYKHSIGVMRCAIELIKREPRLSALPDDIKAQVIDAAILHDTGRVSEVDWQTGDFVKLDHGVEGAVEAFNLGEYSFLTLIAVWVHNKIDERHILMSNSAFERTAYFKNLSDENKVFVQILRKNFKALPKKDRETIMLATEIVKDADKIDNMLNFQDMTSLNRLSTKPEISKSTIRDFYNGGLIREHKTLLDHLFGVMAWMQDLRFQATRDWVKKDGSLKKIKAYSLNYYKKESPATLDKLAREFDKAFEFINSRRKG
jgi:hypothetical protein